MSNIKEVKELLTGLEVVGHSVLSVMKDGKVNMADLPEAVELLNKFSIVYDALEGIKQIPEEMKDLEQEELIDLGLQVFGMVKNFKAVLS